MDDNDSDISVCNYSYIRQGKKTTDNNFFKNNFKSIGKDKYYNIYNEYGYITIHSWNKLYKKKIFQNIRFPNGKIYEDSYIICDILDNAQAVSYLSESLYNYVYRENSIINSFTINQFDIINAINKKIDFHNKRKYYDLALKEKNLKIKDLLFLLSKMKRYGIKNKEVWDKYYRELVNTNKEVKWKSATKYNKFYKVFRKPSISILACMLRVRDLIKK